MINYLEQIELIISKLEKNEFKIIANNLNEIRLSAFTATELLMSFTYALGTTIKENPEIRIIVEKEYIELINFCYNNGIVVKTL